MKIIIFKIIGIILLVTIIVNLLCYSAFSFINWELNPQHWDSIARFAYVIISGFFTLTCIWGSITSMEE